MIIAADLHLRTTTPKSRVDNYFEAQERKFRFILEQAQKSPPLTIAGDFFHQPKPGEFLLQWVINLLNEYGIIPIITPGQHDLPAHSLDRINSSGIGVLAASQHIWLTIDPNKPIFYSDDLYIHGCPYGKSPDMTVVGLPGVLIWHHMVINEPLWPGQIADKANSILKKYHKYKIIVTGDNHQSFAIAETLPQGKVQGLERSFAYAGEKRLESGFSEGIRWIINPGSMMRMTATQINHKPCIYKCEKERVEQIFLPIDENVLDITELEESKERDKRITAFVERLNKEHEIGFSFERNLEEFFKINPINDDVKNIILRCLE